MIYFLQRNTDGAICINLTNDLKDSISTYKQAYGDVELLGVMPGDDEALNNFWQDFGIYHLEGEYEWIWPVDDIFGYIYENATLGDDRVKVSARYKSSEYTPIKQQALEAALRQQINLVVHITERWNQPKPYLYFDLNAGPGFTDNNQPGSPMIFKRIADEYQGKWRKFRYDATLYEASSVTSLKLFSVLGDDPRFKIINNDHEALLEELRLRRKISLKERNWVFGAIYADPSNAALPWDLLEKMNEVYPRVDVMINIACASYKRTISMAGYHTLAERLPRVKDHWIVRRPFGKHQWSILIGTNWPDYPAWKEQDFYPWNDKGIGTSIFEKLVYTPNQIQKRLQLKLWDDEEENKN